MTQALLGCRASDVGRLVMIPEAQDDQLVGRTLGGYQILECIGAGGMGRVYRAEQCRLGRTVAVKVVHPYLVGNPTIEARFITEARATSQLNHPNSVGIIDFGTTDGLSYLVMEYLRGRSLTAVQQEDGPLDHERVADILGQVLDALAEAHQLGIVHRDLKPENIILQSLRSGGDFVKVLDFGVAIVREQAQQCQRLTSPGGVCGTPEYMAPEQARCEEVDPRADLYSCVVILYELLTGELPFCASSAAEILAMQLYQPPPDPRDLTGALTQETVDLLLKGLAKDPADRFQRAEQLAATIRGILGVPPSPTSRRSGQRTRCPRCKFLAEPYQSFCGHCGRRLTPSSKPPLSVAPPPAMAPPRVSLAPPSPSAPAKSARTTAAPLGRGRELEWLQSHRPAMGSTLRGCRVVGPDGVGKTRLLGELAQRLSHDGDTVVCVGADPWRAGVGNWALREAVCALAELPSDGGSAAEWIGASPAAVTGLKALFGRPSREEFDRSSWSDAPPLHLVHSRARSRAAEALRWALGEAVGQAASGRVTLLVDDLHALDGASRHAFEDVVAEPGVGGVLVVATHETGFESQLGDEAIELAGLDEHQAARLVGSEGLAADEVAPPAGGRLPLAIEQLARFTMEGGVSAPDGLVDLIATRIDRLPVARRRVLQAAAVMGDGLPEELLPKLNPHLSDPARHFAALADAGLIARRDDCVWLCHPLVREVALLGIPAAVRRELHQRARSLESDSTPPLEVQALHALEAEDSFEALMLLEQAATHAAEREDLDGCIDKLSRGLDLARQEVARGQLADPLGAVLHFSTKLGDALALNDNLAEAEGVLREALNLAGPKATARPRMLASLAHVAHLRGHREAALDLLGQAQHLVADTDRPRLAAALERLARAWERDPSPHVRLCT